MKTPNPDHPIRNTLTRLALASTMGAAMYFGASPASAAPPVTTGLKLHLDASALTGLNDNDPVTTWTDMSGLGNHATAAGSPIYKAGVLNGQPVIRFDDNSSFTTADLSAQFPTAATVFIVTTISNDDAYTLVKANPGVDEWWRWDGDGNSYPGVFRSGRLEGYCAMPNTGSHVFAISSSASAWEMSINGASQGVAGGDYNAGGAPLVIGNGSSGGGLNGDIAEILIYNRTLDAGELNAIGTYMTVKYGLTTSYPPSGPPAAPTGLTATPLYQGIRLDWTAPAPFGIAGYHVYRGTETGNYGPAPIGTTTSATTFNDMTAVSGGPYYYVVKATNSAGEGAASNEVSASPSAVPVDQTITFTLGLAVTKTAADAPFPDTASAFPSGLAVTYSVTPASPTVATVDAVTGEVTLTGVPGTAIVVADVAATADFNAAQATQTLTVTQAMPVITWTPSPIVVGSVLGSAQLNASSGGVDGTFVYDPPSGTLMDVAGSTNVSVQFTPTDTVKYSTPALKTVALLVVPVETTVIWDTGAGTWNTTTAIWKGNDSGLTTFYTQGNNAIFNSSAGGAITIAPDMAPLTTTVSADSGTYTFSGGPLAGTGTLTKSGNGELLINGTHAYTGGTVINGGKLNLDSNAIPGTGPITINSGVVGDTNGTAFQVNGGTLTNAIIWDRGNVDIRWTGSIWNGPVTLNAPLAFFRNPYCGTINGTISGTGKLHTAQANLGPNNGLTLNGDNTYSGGTINDNGSLILGHPNALGTGPVWLTTAWPWNPVSITAAVDLSGGTGVRNDIELQTDATIYANNNILLSGAISGTGNLTKAGNSSLVLTGTNTYTGATIIDVGTLQCDNPNALGGGALSISTGGAKVNLNYTGTKGVASLTLGGVAKTDNGTYGSVLSGATFQDDTYFAGTGMVRVGPPVSGYDSWAAANAPGQTAGEDYDNDGVENGIEYFMGETGSTFTAMPGLDGTNTVTWPASAAYVGTYEVQTSTDLVTWTNVDPRPVPSSGFLSYTLPTGAPGGKSFVRLLVTPTP